MRSGGVVGVVQEKITCNRKPVPTRHLQPLSQGLSALPAPLFDRGRFCGNAGRHRKAGRARSAPRRESGAMPQGVALCGDRGGLIKRGPRRKLRRGKEPCSSRKPSSFWTGGSLPIKKAALSA